jgi:hypothetical protein
MARAVKWCHTLFLRLGVDLCDPLPHRGVLGCTKQSSGATRSKKASRGTGLHCVHTKKAVHELFGFLGAQLEVVGERFGPWKGKWPAAITLYSLWLDPSLLRTKGVVVTRRYDDWHAPAPYRML